MKTVDEVIALGKTYFKSAKDLEGRVFWHGQITDCLQVKVMTGMWNDNIRPRMLFNFALDVIVDGDRFLVTSIVGQKWGINLFDCIAEVVKYSIDPQTNYIPECYCLVVMDDPIDEDRANPVFAPDAVEKLTLNMEELKY